MTAPHPDVAAVLDGLDASDGPVDRARVLPPEAYMSPAFHEFEMAAVYMRTWLCVGRAQQIPAPGDYMAMTLADEPILVVRGGGDRLHHRRDPGAAAARRASRGAAADPRRADGWAPRGRG